jgi:PAS domain S-box-containing protein
VERTFDRDDVIVSKTDPQGRITYANEIFLQVSAFAEEDLLGQPHNVIRHPDMPACVFALLWERIQAGQEIFGVINNLAADGANYWVLAHVTPTFDDRGKIVGYHSNRRVPSPGAVQIVTPIYRQLLAEERTHPGKREGIAAGRRLLDSLVAEAAGGYDEFVWTKLETSGVDL